MPASLPLAIVIPAFKARFLGEALRSVAAQTDQRFHLYVCDDGSPEDLRPVCEGLFPPGQMTYRRFDPNMGARDLVRHWNRSVEVTREPWVWLFSDDDLMEPACVETFLRAVESAGDGGPAVYRFNTLTMDAHGRVVAINPPHPLLESAIEFAYHRLTSQRQSFAPEYLFRRKAWEQCGGFVDLPYAQGSDDASWISFAGERGIRLLAGPRVRWRRSSANISTSSAAARVERIKGCVEFAAWLRRRFAGQSPLPADVPGTLDMASLARDWMLATVRNCLVVFSWRDLHELPALLQEKLGVPRRQALQDMLRANVRTLTRGWIMPLRRWLIDKNSA